ncbi:MAG TPA: acetate--CoA ligase family protein, partial [Propionibacteriaceae bacterium]|nr:acetate--CoA ligase family protein [Propionibacteriaceae bacterium]
FADAGYRLSKGIEDGVLNVEFPILPTDTSVGVMERREHRAERASVERLLTPQRIAVYGTRDRVQGLVNAILGGGYRGEVVAVCSDGCEAVGVPSEASLAAITGRLDLALVSVASAADLGEVVIDVAHKGAHGIVLLTGNNVRPRDNHTVVKLARAYGIRALGPDALGLINTAIELNATPGPMPRRGGVGLFCQSAAVGVGTLNYAVRSDLGVSSFISTGDYADVTANDVMQYWEDDPATRVCLLSLESLGNPRKFSRITRRLTRRKPVVVFAPGRISRPSHWGVRGGLGHAPDEAIDALFRQAGVMVVHRRGAMMDIAKIAARQPLPSGPRVGIVSNSVTLATQMTHTVEAVGLLSDYAPVLLGAVAEPTEFAEAARTALADPAYNSVVCAAVNVFDQGTEDVIEALEDVAAEAGKPLVGVFMDFHPPLTSDAAPDEPGRLPRFDSAVDAIYALSALSAYAHWRNRHPGAVPLLEVDEVAAQRLVNEVLAGSPQGRELTEAETSRLMGAFGITLVPRFHVDSLDRAIEVAERLGWHVALKATNQALGGRPDLASVYRNIDDASEMADAWRDLGRLVTDLGLAADPALTAAGPVVQQMAPPGVSLVITSREYAAFGPIVSLGLAGIPSELLGDTVYRVPPLTTGDASAMVRDLKAAPVLFGQHETPGVDIPGIEDLLHRVAQLADANPQVASVTLSPCIASRNSVSVLGARVLIAPTANRRDPLTRTL